MSESSFQLPSKQRDAQPAPIISNLKNIQPALGPIMTEKPSTITGSAESATRLRGGCCVRLLPLVFQFQLFIRTLGMLQLLSVLMLLLLRKEGRSSQISQINWRTRIFLIWSPSQWHGPIQKLYTNLRIRPIFNPFLYYKVFLCNMTTVLLYDNASYPAFRSTKFL